MNRYNFVLEGGQQVQADGDAVVDVNGVTVVMDSNVIVTRLDTASITSRSVVELGDDDYEFDMADSSDSNTFSLAASDLVQVDEPGPDAA